ncbi:MAG: T9SS type A sorting domain-containing protein [Bacteroidota bacterium]|nr:T9SS type A sorting domain-containing protein [Bacteroidota bacterium]
MKKQISFLLMILMTGLMVEGYAFKSGEIQKNSLQFSSTYLWKGANGASWTEPSNWEPQRIQVSANDILLFNTGNEFTVTNVADENIGQLKIFNHTRITFQTNGEKTLFITGLDGDDLVTESGSRLGVSGSNALHIVLAAGTNGIIGGSVVFANGKHTLEAGNENGLIFSAGSEFTAESGFTGNPFGTSSLNSVIFESSSTYICKSGDHPFGAAAPKSVVVFKDGSRYIHQSKEYPSLCGRKYAGFELDDPEADIWANGNDTLALGDLTITRGILFLNLTKEIKIRGNLTVQSPGKLGFRPDRENMISFTGNVLQWISGNGDIEITENTQFILNNEVCINREINFSGALKITPIGKLTISPGGYVSVQKDFSNDNTEGILIHSHSGGTGSLIDYSGMSGQGTARVELYLQPAMWHYVSSPVADARAGTFSGDYVKSSDPGSVSGWGPWITNPSAPLEVMCGYAVWKPTSNQNIECFSGRLNTGDIRIRRSRHPDDPYAGWHLLGNPYPSSLDLDSRSIKWNEFEPTAWFWDQGGQGGTGNYRAYPALLAPPPEVGEHSSQVPPMQGFFVHINSNFSGETELSLNNETRIHGNESFLKKTNRTMEKFLAIKATGSANGYSDNVFIHFDPDYTEYYDAGYDAWKLSGLVDAPQLYSYTGKGDKVTFNCLPFKNMNMTVPVEFSCSIAGNFTLTASLMKSFPESMAILLEDLLTDEIRDLRRYPEYSFYSIPGNNPDRFLLHFQESGSSVADQADKTDLRIYSGGKEIFIESNANLPEGSLKVFDMMGREVATREFEKASLIRIPLSVPKGYYIVRAIFGDKVLVKKVLL